MRAARRAGWRAGSPGTAFNKSIHEEVARGKMANGEDYVNR